MAHLRELIALEDLQLKQLEMKRLQVLLDQMKARKSAMSVEECQPNKLEPVGTGYVDLSLKFFPVLYQLTLVNIF